MTARRTCAAALFLALSLGACASHHTTAPDTARANAVLRQALQAHAEGDLAHAQQLYLETLRLDPSNKYAYYDLGVIAQSQGDDKVALSSYRGALAIDPRFVPALFNLAIVETAADQTKDAKDLYKRVLEIDPQDAAAHLNFGFLLRAEGRERAARREFDDAVRLDPSLADRISSGADARPATTGPTGATGG